MRPKTEVSLGSSTLSEVKNQEVAGTIRNLSWNGNTLTSFEGRRALGLGAEEEAAEEEGHVDEEGQPGGAGVPQGLQHATPPFSSALRPSSHTDMPRRRAEGPNGGRDRSHSSSPLPAQRFQPPPHLTPSKARPRVTLLKGAMLDATYYNTGARSMTIVCNEGS